MSKSKNKKKILIPVLCVLVVVGILCGIFVPRLFTKNAVQFNLGQGEQKGYEFGEDYKSFVKTDSAVLYVNEKTSAVAIADRNGKVVFNSHSNDAAENKLACVLSLTVRDSVGNSYIENSTINSADFGKFKVEKR